MCVYVYIQVFPRVLRARELDAHQAALTAGNGEDALTPARSTGGGNVMDWVTPLEQYMTGLPMQQRKPHTGIRDPGRQVAIVTTASLPWLTGMRTRLHTQTRTRVTVLTSAARHGAAGLTCTVCAYGRRL